MRTLVGVPVVDLGQFGVFSRSGSAGTRCYCAGYFRYSVLLYELLPVLSILAARTRYFRPCPIYCRYPVLLPPYSGDILAEVISVVYRVFWCNRVRGCCRDEMLPAARAGERRQTRCDGSVKPLVSPLGCLFVLFRFRCLRTASSIY